MYDTKQNKRFYQVLRWIVLFQFYPQMIKNEL